MLSWIFTYVISSFVAYRLWKKHPNKDAATNISAFVYWLIGSAIVSLMLTGLIMAFNYQTHETFERVDKVDGNFATIRYENNEMAKVVYQFENKPCDLSSLDPWGRPQTKDYVQFDSKIGYAYLQNFTYEYDQRIKWWTFDSRPSGYTVLHLPIDRKMIKFQYWYKDQKEWVESTTPILKK
jgi:hypothetical protein